MTESARDQQEFSFISGESFYGAVARWAADFGGAERLRDLTGVAGVQYGHRQHAASATPDQIRALAREMGVDADGLLDRATPRVRDDLPNRSTRHWFFGTIVPLHLLEKRVRRYSPAALASSPHDRAVWHIRLFPFCAETWEFLLTGCPDPECGSTPAWQRTLGIDRCEHCGGDLTKAVTETVPEASRPRLKAAISLVHPDPARRAATMSTLPPSLAGEDPETILELLHKLVAVADPGIPTDPLAMYKLPPLPLCRAIARAWGVLEGWPAAMTELASERITTRLGRHGDGNGGRTLRFLSPRRNTDTSVEVADIIAAWRDTIDLNGPNRSALLSSTRSITQAAAQLAIGTSVVADLRRQGVFKPVFVLDSQGSEPRYDAAEINRLARLMKARLPIDRARLALGVPSHAVEQLVAMRIVDQEANRFIRARYDVMQIVASSIQRLAADLAANARGSAKQCTLPLHDAMKAVGGRLKPWGPAFKSLLEGELPYVLAPGTAALSRRILVGRASIGAIRALDFDPSDATHVQITHSRTMSKIDAGETLNLGFSQSIPLLGAIRTRTGTKQKLVPVDYVQRLAAAHMSSTELAARRGVTAQRAYHDAIRAKVCELGHGGFCRIAAEAEFFS